MIYQLNIKNMLKINLKNFFFKFKNVSFISNFAGSSYLEPIKAILKSHGLRYWTPSTIAYTWSFGSLLGFYFVLQIVTGLWLTSHYVPSIHTGFETIIKISHDVKYGSIVKNMHSNGASMIFILLYLHIARGLYYRSYSYTRKAAWISGLIMFVLMMATAFLGYMLPWGQMSFWGAQVITSFLTVIPWIGFDVQAWASGGYGISQTTLTRFYGLHIILPFIIGIFIGIHLILIHKAGSTSGTQFKDDQGISFHPYFSIKDAYGFLLSLLLYGYLIFFNPLALSHPDNSIPANSLVTPTHIVPEWYFTPFYAILRAFPNKAAGIIAMGFAILIFALIPFINLWLNSLIKKNITKNNLNFQFDINEKAWEFKSHVSLWHQFFFWVFCFNFLLLIYFGCQPAAEPYVFASRLSTFFYFAYFIVIIPWLYYLDYSVARTAYQKK